MDEVAAVLRDRKIGNQEHNQYGGLIFTSQRAVEGFIKLVEDGKNGRFLDVNWLMIPRLSQSYHDN